MKVRIADVVFDAKQRTLSHINGSRKLEPKVFTLLTSLLNASGEIVTRDQLIALVWNNRVVGDGAINRTVSLLRNHFLALTSEDVIETVPTQGYRLVAQTELIESTSSNSIKNATGDNRQRPNKNKVALSIKLATLILLTIIIGLLSWFFSAKNQQHADLNTTLINDPLVGLKGWEYDISTTTTGNKVLFHHQAEDGVQRVYLYNTDTHKKQAILKNARAAINAKGDAVIFAQKNTEMCSFNIFNVASQQIKHLFNCDEIPSKLVWKDSTHFYFNKRLSKSHPYQVFSFDVATHRLMQISNPKSNNNLKGDFNFAHNHKTQQLAILRYLNENQTELIIQQPDSSEEKHTLNKRITSLAWSPQTNSIILADRSTLYHYSPDAQTLNIIKQLEIDINSLAVASKHQSHYLLLSSKQVTSDIMSHNIDDNTDHIWQQSAGVELLPRSANGNDLILSTRYKNHHFWQIENNEPVLLDIELPFELQFTRYELSPNGNNILLTNLGASYEIDLYKKSITQLFSKQHKSYVSNYFSDQADNIIYSSNKSGQWQLWLFDRASKKHQQITQNGGYSGRVINNTLYFTKYSRDGLWTKNLSGQEEQLLLKDFSLLNWLNWQLVGDHIYFYRADSGIWQYSITNKDEKLLMTKPDNFVHQYTVIPNENVILWVKLRPVEGDIYQYQLTLSP
ncbi:winged helix-turn-helix domain-containing protein [Thalassotalea sp. 1_MG-2023]|uniref:winged helix-turn-helix domain-containing protein n=1 Tax=Thalassotalea sp. 1_MG-2023 TaxID=3062680 RepID=UPI0026E3A0E2|nr:winged helix-turn-helix domain-containing protein [Thalassotalea sp. 1_MG-2023]MDO6426366.1 winged helix-turn-helix domain-containing protein [Thalassotalea sp. 1_MG-2023]